MALLCNFARNNLGSHMAVIGGAQSLTPGNGFRASWFKNWRAQDVSTSYLKTAAAPPGYYPPAAYMMPITAGEMAAGISGEGGVTADLYPSKNMEADLTGSGSLTATAALVISMSAALTGAGSLSATITGRLNATAALTGSGGITAAALTGIGSMESDLTGSGSIAANVSAIASMAADIVSTGTILTTANVGSSVWSALAASNNLTGTMGQKLNSAASAGDPWSTTLPGSYDDDQAGALMYLILQMLRNGVKTDKDTGTMTVYADDGVNVLFTAPIFNDANGAEPYDGTAGINRRDRLE